MFSSSLIEKIKQHILTNKNIVTVVIKTSNKFKSIDEIIFHERNQINVLERIRLRILKDFHDSFTVKHFERNKTLKSLKNNFTDQR